MIEGCVIGESLRVGGRFAPPNVRIARVTRLDVSGSATGGQPAVWTVIDFTGDDADADEIARELAGNLSADGGWYADFRVGDDHVVVYADRVFRYRRGDGEARAEAVAHGRTVGVPDHQLDWRD